MQQDILEIFLGPLISSEIRPATLLIKFTLDYVEVWVSFQEKTFLHLGITLHSNSTKLGWELLVEAVLSSFCAKNISKNINHICFYEVFYLSKFFTTEKGLTKENRSYKKPGLSIGRET